MVEPLPTELPIWNTGGGNRVEPLPAEKVSGWAVNDQPPSSYFNWLQYYTGAWFTWMSERLTKGALEHDVTLQALTPTAAGDGGDVTILSGAANGVNASGDILIKTADSTVDDTGTITIKAGDVSSSGPGIGGDLLLYAGDGWDNDGGDVNLFGGDANGTGSNVGGEVIIAGGVAGAGTGGRVRIVAGGAGSSGGIAGNIEIAGAIGNTQGSNVTITAGNSPNDGGNITITAGSSTTAGDGGDVTITAGDGDGAQLAGNINITGGAAADTNAGEVNITGGSPTGTDRQAGLVVISTGASTGQQSATITLKVAEPETGGSGSGSYSNTPTEYLFLDGSSGNKKLKASRYLELENQTAVDAIRGVMRLTPKTPDPTGPSEGDLVAHSGTHQTSVHNGTRYHALNRLVYSNSDGPYKGISPVSPNWTLNAYHAFELAAYGGTGQGTPLRYTIPAGSLRDGSIIRVRAIFENTPVTASDYLSPAILLGTPLAGSPPYPITTPLVAPNVAAFVQNRASLVWGLYALECEIRVRTIGASGRLDYGGWGQTSTVSGASPTYVVETLGDASNYNTTSALDVYPAVLCASAQTEYAECLKFIVEIV